MEPLDSQIEHGLQIAPMLDVLFVLLLFFMVATGLQQRESFFPVQIPDNGDAQGAPDTHEPIRITIDESGVMAVNNQRIENSQNSDDLKLQEKLASLIVANPDRLVLIQPHAKASHQRVLDVLSICERANVTNAQLVQP